MISKATIKFIKSLQIKKYRKQEQCFVVEGSKSVEELLRSDFDVITLVGTPDFFHGSRPGKHIEQIEASEKELSTLGEFQTNTSALAVVRMRPNKKLLVAPDEFGLVLDDIRDPGNLGTIIRVADWYGISKIIASEETADVYNSKVVTATMGSFTRTNVYYTDLLEYIPNYAGGLLVIGALLKGENVHDYKFGAGGLIVIGNESRGISPEVEALITDRITIPRYGHAESLNAAIATAIICDNLRRSR